MKKHKNLKTVLYSSLVLGAVVVAFNTNTASASAATTTTPARWGQAKQFDAAAATDTPAKDVTAAVGTSTTTGSDTTDTSVNSATVESLTAAVKAASDAKDADGASAALQQLDAYYAKVGDNALDKQGTVAINATNFPDAVFRAFVLTIAQQATGKNVTELTPDTLKLFGQLDLSDLHFENIQGIEYFKALQKLTLDGNDISDLAVLQDNPILGELYAKDMGSDLKVADLTKFPILYKGQFGSRGATAVSDTADNIDLQDGDVTFARDKTLQKIITNPTLDSLQVAFSDALTTVDTSASAHLTDLGLLHNSGLKDVDVTANPDLQSLAIRDSSDIQKLDLSKNTQLKTLGISMTLPADAAKGQVVLKDFTLPDAPALDSLDLANVAVDSATLDKVLQDYPVLSTVALQGLGLATLDLSHNPELTIAVLNGNQLTELQGLDKLPYLEAVALSDNQFTSLDFTKNTRLTRVNAASNKLKSLSFAPQTTANNVQKLSYLDVSHNELDEASFNTTLNKLTGLNTLLAAGNGLTHIDLSKNVYLGNVDFSDNKLRTLDMSTNVSSSRNAANIFGQTITDQAFYSQKDAKGDTKYYFNLKAFLDEDSKEDLAQYATVPSEVGWKLDTTTGVAVYQGEGKPTDIEYNYAVGAMLTLPVHVDLQAAATVASYQVNFSTPDGKATVTNKPVTLTSSDDGVLKAADVPTYTVNDANYHFVGWEDATGQAVKLDQTGQVFGSKTLYAVVAPNAYTVSFDTVGGTKLADAQAKTAAGSKTSTYTLPAGPKKANFTFTGWADDRGNEYAAGDTVKLSADTKFTAQYKAVGATTVSLTVAVKTNIATATGATVTGTATAGANLAVVDQYGVTVATGSADSKGAFTLNAKGVVSGDTLSVTATKPATAATTYTSATAKSAVKAAVGTHDVVVTEPAIVTGAPAKKAPAKATSLKLDKAYAANKYVTGQTTAKAKVTVTNKAGKVLGRATANAKGKFTVKLKTAKVQTVTVSATATNKTAKKATLKVKKSPAPKRSSLKLKQKTLTGQTTQGATVKVYNAKGKLVAKKHVTAKTGKFTLKLKKAYKKGTKFTIKVQNDHAHGFAKAQKSLKAK